MKRLIFLFFVFLFLVGCDFKSSKSSKVLECNFNGNVGGTLSEQNYKVIFINDHVDKLSVNINVSLGEPDDVTLNNLENDVNSAFEDYKNHKGVSYFSNIKDNGFSVSLDVDFNELSDEDKSSISLINSEKSYDEIKSEFENDGFSCK